MNLPAEALKLVSTVIVAIAISSISAGGEMNCNLNEK